MYFTVVGLWDVGMPDMEQDMGSLNGYAPSVMRAKWYFASCPWKMGS